MPDTVPNEDSTLNTSLERAEEIFCDALEKQSGRERDTFVKQACGVNAELLDQVKELLESHEDAEKLFETISPTSVSVVELSHTLMDKAVASGREGALPADDGEVGKQIGLYKLLKKLGEGGGGSVYLAEQVKPVRRQVALKIIKLGMDTKNVIARFEAERQVLAMMEHPNIAHVLNAGETEEGRPFFVMELVHGTRITQYCDEYGLTVLQRLDLFIKICHAIQHAHQKGIIHRDIKPSNIIIAQLDGEAVPKVIDFGIAKATGGQLLSDRTAYTAVEQLVGTPVYMSPEQADLAELDIDIRSDIYSLGILLYELLISKTPFDQKKLIRSGLEEMRRTIREREPPRPSVKLAGLPDEELTKIAECRSIQSNRFMALLEGDLDWIVMKAMDKDREFRYQSADGLADDIQRYLNHEPVVARPPSRLYLLKKLIRRNKVVFAAGSITVAVMLISSGVSTWLLIKERIARQRALIAEQQKGELQEETTVLRVSVRSQEKLAQASVFFRRGDMEQADAILDEIENSTAGPDNASMYRDVGDWHALNSRWDKARARFAVLAQINEFEDADSSMDDNRSAALLVEQGYLEDYNRFRESLVARYAGTESPTIAQRTIRECLLVPANEELMIALNQFARVTDQSFNRVDESPKSQLGGWQAYAMALLNYRQGDCDATLEWCMRANPANSGFPTRDYSVLLIQALALHQSGQQAEAKVLLECTRSAMKNFFTAKPSKSKQWQGYWFDRAYLRIHLREAESLIEQSSIPQSDRILKTH